MSAVCAVKHVLEKFHLLFRKGLPRTLWKRTAMGKSLSALVIRDMRDMRDMRDGYDEDGLRKHDAEEAPHLTGKTRSNSTFKVLPGTREIVLRGEIAFRHIPEKVSGALRPPLTGPAFERLAEMLVRSVVTWGRFPQRSFDREESVLRVRDRRRMAEARGGSVRSTRARRRASGGRRKKHRRSDTPLVRSVLLPKLVRRLR